MRLEKALFLLALGVSAKVLGFSLEDESAILERLMTPDYVVADGKLLDMNTLKPERTFVPWLNETKETARQKEAWYTAHYQALTAGISGLEYGWSNSILAIFGEKAFPIATSGSGDVTIAGAEYGKGRVIVMPRIEYAISTNNQPSMSAFIANAIPWLAQGSSSMVVATHLDDQVGTYKDTRKSVMPLTLATSPDVNVYFVNAHQTFTAEEYTAIQNFVKNGGGLLIGGQAWYLGIPEQGQYATRFPGNKIISVMGVLIGYYDWSQRISPVSPMPSLDFNVLSAVQQIKTGALSTTASNTLTRVGGYVLSLDTANLPEFKSIIDLATAGYTAATSTMSKNTFSRLSELLLPILVNVNPPISVVAPNVAAFPGEVASTATSVTKTITINGTTNTHPGQFIYSGAGSDHWKFTGLYAKAGSIVTVTLPASVVGKVGVQIGSHTDTLYDKESQDRYPQIVMRFKTLGTTVKATNPFGGLIYITIPQNSAFGRLEITVADAFEAPHYIHGTTTDAEWNDRIKNLPAPWAEIEVPGQLILTVPTSMAKEVSKINDVGSVYADIMSYVNKLAGLEKRFRTERFTFDIQIGGGWMHSGYPMMGFTSAVPFHLNATALRSEGTWGIIHEIGHNHQWNSWTIGATTETGCNWFSLYVNQKLFGIKWNHPEMTPESSKARLNDWVSRGKPFADWTVWLALDTYSILAEAFTWESYTPLIMEYYNLPQISGDSVKLDTWARKYSQAVNTNLCPYFTWFNWPLTPETRTICDSLPAWDQNPMKNYEG